MRDTASGNESTSRALEAGIQRRGGNTAAMKSMGNDEEKLKVSEETR